MLVVIELLVGVGTRRTSALGCIKTCDDWGSSARIKCEKSLYFIGGE